MIKRISIFIAVIWGVLAPSAQATQPECDLVQLVNTVDSVYYPCHPDKQFQGVDYWDVTKVYGEPKGIKARFIRGQPKDKDMFLEFGYRTTPIVTFEEFVVIDPDTKRPVFSEEGELMSCARYGKETVCLIGDLGDADGGSYTAGHLFVRADASQCVVGGFMEEHCTNLIQVSGLME